MEGNDFARNILRYITRLERQKRRYLDDCLKKEKLRGPMYMILTFLEHEPGAIQDDLSAYLGIDKSGITRLCRKLEDLGYIRREQPSEDRRRNKLYLTGSGTALLPVIRAHLQNFREIITAGMDGAEQEALQFLLERMMNNALSNE